MVREKWSETALNEGFFYQFSMCNGAKLAEVVIEVKLRLKALGAQVNPPVAFETHIDWWLLLVTVSPSIYADSTLSTSPCGCESLFILIYSSCFSQPAYNHHSWFVFGHRDDCL